MARIPNGRKPAEAQTPEEVERRQGLLAAAALLVERDGYERVQMTEIARTAGVAIGTLYRYFPSKAKLFEVALYEEMALFAAEWTESPSSDRIGEVADHLVLLTRQIAGRPRLAAAMFHASMAGYATATVEERGRTEMPLPRRILEAVGIDNPTAMDLERAQLLRDAWWSILVKIVVGHLAFESGESQLRLACRLLLLESVATP